MLRVYKMPNGKTYQFNEGEQPECAVLVERPASRTETPENRAEKAAARKRAPRKPKEA